LRFKESQNKGSGFFIPESIGSLMRAACLWAIVNGQKTFRVDRPHIAGVWGSSPKAPAVGSRDPTFIIAA